MAKSDCLLSNHVNMAKNITFGGDFFGGAIRFNLVNGFHHQIGMRFVEVFLERLKTIHFPFGLRQFLAIITTATIAAAATTASAIATT